MTSIEQRLTRIEAHLGIGKAEQPKKPPLGVKPKWLIQQNRRDELALAIKRYEEAGQQVPQEWIDEHRELETALELRRNEQAPTKERAFEAFYVQCTKEEYPEVKRILEAQGYELKYTEWTEGDDCVTTTNKGVYMTYEMSDKEDDDPTYTLPELREKFGVEQPPKSKTRIEWLQELPDGYRERAVSNYKEWTPEDWEFWLDVYNYYLIGQPLPPLPSGNSEKPNAQEPTVQRVYDAGFWFGGTHDTVLNLPDKTMIWMAYTRWVKANRGVCEPQPHTLTPVSHHTVGRFYALAGIEPNRLNDYRNYALCVSVGDISVFVRASEQYGIIGIDRIRRSHVSLNEVTPV